MVVLHNRGMDPYPHFLVPKKDLGKWKAGQVKEVYVMVMTDGRYNVMARSWNDYTNVLFKDENELHNAFNEQTAITG